MSPRAVTHYTASSPVGTFLRDADPIILLEAKRSFQNDCRSGGNTLRRNHQRNPVIEKDGRRRPLDTSLGHDINTLDTVPVVTVSPISTAMVFR